MKTMILFILLATTLPLLSQQKQFKKALDKNTIESYEKFIDKYPDSGFADSAAYKKAWLYTDKVKYLKEFAKDYPNSRLIEDALFNIANIASTVQNWEAYFKKYPNGIYRTQAEDMYYREIMKSKKANELGKFVTLIPDSKYSEEVEYQEAKGKNDIYYWGDFIKKYPDSKYLEDAEFNNAKLRNNVIGWDDFIKKYPNSTHIVESEFMRVNLIRSVSELQEFKNRYPDNKYEEEIDRLITDISLWNSILHEGKFTDYQQYLNESKAKIFSITANDTLLIRAKRHIKNLSIPSIPDNQLILTRLKSNSIIDGKTNDDIQYIYAGSSTYIRIKNIRAFYRPLKSSNILELPANLIDSKDTEFPLVVAPSLSDKTQLIIGDIEQIIDFSSSFLIEAYGSYFIDSEMNISNSDLLSISIFNYGNLTYKEETKTETTILTFSFDNGTLKDVNMNYWGIKDGNRMMSKSYEPKNTPLKVTKSFTQLIGIGTTQIILGNIILKGYEFYSDNDNPLVFKMSDNGYVYVTGKGKIIDTVENKTYNL